MNTLEFGPEDKRYTRKILEAVIRVGVVALLILWSFEIFKPFLGPIVWGSSFRLPASESSAG